MPHRRRARLPHQRSHAAHARSQRPHRPHWPHDAASPNDRCGLLTVRRRAILPLCARTTRIVVGSPMMASARLCNGLHERVHKIRRTAASHFLIIGKRQMHGRSGCGLLQTRHGSENDGEKALHVGRTATIDALIADHACEWRHGPGLPVHRHHIRMRRQDHARTIHGTDSREQRGLAAIRRRHAARRHARRR